MPSHWFSKNGSHPGEGDVKEDLFHKFPKKRECSPLKVLLTGRQKRLQQSLEKIERFLVIWWIGTYILWWYLHPRKKPHQLYMVGLFGQIFFKAVYVHVWQGVHFICVFVSNDMTCNVEMRCGGRYTTLFLCEWKRFEWMTALVSQECDPHHFGRWS